MSSLEGVVVIIGAQSTLEIYEREAGGTRLILLQRWEYAPALQDNPLLVTAVQGVADVVIDACTTMGMSAASTRSYVGNTLQRLCVRLNMRKVY